MASRCCYKQRDPPAPPAQTSASYGEQNYSPWLSALTANVSIHFHLSGFKIFIFWHPRKVMVGWVCWQKIRDQSCPPCMTLESQEVIEISHSQGLWYLVHLFHRMKWYWDVSVMHNCWIPTTQRQKSLGARGCKLAFKSEYTWKW